MVKTTNQIKDAETEAAILLNSAMALSKASISNDEKLKLITLET